ncbi:MAG: NAD-dependent epimerase/dehydratase family protein [Planctomycetota bacterium]
MPHRALITGVSGFVGGFLAEHLLESGDAVLGCSPDGAWEEAAPPSLSGRVELIAWDLGRSDRLDTEARRRIEQFRPDALYHLAAVSIPEDCGNRRPTARATAVNVEGTRRVLELAASLASPPRVLFTSTSHVYAPVGRGRPQVDENAPLGPMGAYGRTKLAAEEEVRRAVAEAGCHAVVARSFQHTGPRQSPRMMLPQWAEQFARGGTEPVSVYTLNARIDLTDVRDVVRAYRLLMEHGRPGETCNVGSGACLRTGDVFEMLRQMADPQRPVVETHPGEKQDPIADPARLTGLTGWQPKIPLEQTVADTLAWWHRPAAGRHGEDSE